jgi:glycosyltransferase involved in cell wall biosynthesis
LAAGVPYVQPAHGAFPEIHQRLGGGHLYAPESPAELADRLREVLGDLRALRRLGRSGRERVLQDASTIHEAQRFIEILQCIV